jgi:hypothetical protein
MQVDAHSDFIQNWYVCVCVCCSKILVVVFIASMYTLWCEQCFSIMCVPIGIVSFAVLIMFVCTICGRDVEVASMWGSTNNEYAVLSTIPPG